MRCRTADLGGHAEVCTNGHVAGVWYNSCRNRFCPQCTLIGINEWLERKKALLAPVRYRHLTFTLPHEYLPLWRWNRKLMADLLFDSAQSTIRKLLSDPKWCGGLPGALLGLHTWNRQLLLHPHVHALVTEGGLASDGSWRKPKKSLFLPTEVLRSVFRGKFQQRLERRIRSGQLRLPPDLDERRALKLMKRASTQEWIVDRRRSYDHGGGVATYLARYMRGGPLKNHQLIEADGSRVRLRYVRHQSRKRKSAKMTLSTDEFLRRWLEHVPVAGMHLVRAYGLFHPQYRAALDKLRASLGCETAPRSSSETTLDPDPTKEPKTCSECGAPLVRLALPRARPPPLIQHASGLAPPFRSVGPRSPRGRIPIGDPRTGHPPRSGRRPTRSIQVQT